MSDQSKIEWCDSTLRLWNGCSPSKERPTGCAHCYATRDAVRMAGNPNPKIRAAYEGLTTPKGHWNGTLRLASVEMWDQPYRWKRGRVVFVNSGSDTFHEKAGGEINRLLRLMHGCQQHTFLLLTKRIERASDILVERAAELEWLDIPMPLPNVYLGMSASTQPELDSGAPAILRLAQAGWKTFLSLEPLCGSIDLLGMITKCGTCGYVKPERRGTERYWCPVCDHSEVHWAEPGIEGVIVGGESGPHARPMHPDWVRSICDQCAAAEVDFFFKQWGEFVPYEDSTPPFYQSQHGDFFDGHGLPDFQTDEDKRGWICTDDLDLFRRVGKHAAGRLLDGQTHDALPWGDKLKGLKP